MKRSPQIALVLMGATGLGATSYAMAPRTDCTPPGQPRPAVVAGVPAKPECRESTWHRSSGGYTSSSAWRSSSSTSRSIWGRSSSASSAGFTSGPVPSSTVRAVTSTHTSSGIGSSSPSVARGGFGSTGHGSSSGG